ncbi:MAG: hypothetical protein CL675_04050 [Bdellovibrionaceae bacterium]|nr:hypothetical protein [Pseudobdellovibrionaceae bacterium]
MIRHLGLRFENKLWANLTKPIPLLGFQDPVNKPLRAKLWPLQIDHLIEFDIHSVKLLKGDFKMLPVRLKLEV